MLKKLTIEGIARFKDTQTLEALAERNVFFGPNGSGKTTLSKEIRAVFEGNSNENTKAEFSKKCHNVTTFDTTRVQKLFKDSTRWPGIYTTNDNHEKLQQLRNAQSKEDQLRKDLSEIEKLFRETEAQLNKTTRQIKQKIWLFANFRSNPAVRDLFKGINTKDKLYAFYKNNADDLEQTNFEKLHFAELFKEAAKTNSAPIEKIALPDLTSLHSEEIHTLLGTPILSSDNSIFTDFIKHLGNEKWILEGQDYVRHSNNLCPFCQTTLQKTTKEHFQQYFDKNYHKSIHQLKAMHDYCKSLMNNANFPDEKLLPTHLKEAYRVNLFLFKDYCQNIINAILQKLKSPSQIIKIERNFQIVDRLIESVQSLNRWILQYNSSILDLDSFRNEMQIEYMCALYSEHKAKLLPLTYDFESLEGAFEVAEKKYTQAAANLTRVTDEKDAILREMSSVTDTVEKINKILKSYGFDNFYLAVNGSNKTYRLRRTSEADESVNLLSEGEKNLLGFLYFYFNVLHHLGQNEEFAVCIDDPVSSTDQHGTAIICHLTRDLMNRVSTKKQTTKLVQIFIFSHNTHFANEIVQFQKGKPRAVNCFILSKLSNEKTKIDFVAKHPFISVYSQLWRDVFYSDVGNSTKCNSMRRILEHYFSFLGHIDMADLKLDLSGNVHSQCSATIEALHAFSHRIEEPVEFMMDDANFAHLKEGFRSIFEVQGQIQHYDHMMQSIEEAKIPSS